jgi:conjugal transfer pilin signal peptidase TrbI
MSMIAVWSRSRPAPRYARAQRRMAAFAAAVVAGLLVWALVYALTPYRLWFNLVSDSLPGFVYLVELGTVPAQRGDAIVFRPPPNRFYPPGLKFAKLAMGLPGDVISRDAQDRRVFVNGAFFGDLRTTSSLGALQPGPVGVVPPDHYWVWTAHPLSLDSRYADIGYIPRDRVLGRAVRLL